jgi:hypothetical protein
MDNITSVLKGAMFGIVNIHMASVVIFTARIVRWVMDINK